MGSPTRRWFLQAGLAGLAGLSMAQTAPAAGTRHATAEVPSRPVNRSKVGHPVLALGRSRAISICGTPSPTLPARFAGPSARSRPTCRACGSANICRCRRRYGQADGHPLGGLLGQQPHADHDAGGQPAGPAHGRRQGWRRLSVDGLGRGEVPRRQRPGLPAFVGLADCWKADVWGAGEMGRPSSPSRARELPAGWRCRRA